jgi:hypothetical protein
MNCERHKQAEVAYLRCYSMSETEEKSERLSQDGEPRGKKKTEHGTSKPLNRDVILLNMSCSSW